MAQVSKPASSSPTARDVFAGVTEAPKSTPSASNAAKTNAKSDPAAPPLSFEQTISAAVDKSATKPTEKAAGASTQDSKQNQERDKAAPRPDAAATASSKPLTTSSVTPQEEKETQAAPARPQTLLLTLLDATTESTTSETSEGDAQDAELPPTETKTTGGTGPASDLTLYLAAGPSTPILACPVPPPANSGGPVSDPLTINASTAKSASESTSSPSPLEQMPSANSSQPPVETRQNGIVAMPDRPILPSSPTVRETLSEPLSTLEPTVVPTDTEPVGLEGKSAVKTNPEATQIARQTPVDTAIQGPVPGMGQESPTAPPPPSTANASDTGVGEELLSRFQITARGTSVASEEEVMKTSNFAAPAVPASQAGISLEKTAVSAPGGEGSMSLAQQPRPDTDLDQPKDSKSGSDRDEGWTASIEQTHTSSASTTGIAGEAVEEVSRPTDPHSIEMLRNEILTRVVEFGDENPTSMTVVLRPDQGTELTVHLKSHDGRIEVQVRLERGNDQAYRSSWESLQQSLSQRGVSLGSLESASASVLTRPTTPAELRNEVGGVTSNLRAIEATVAATSSSNLMSGSDQREPGARDSRTPTNETGWDSGDESRGKDQTFSFDDRNLGREGRPAPTSPIWINPSRRGPLLTAEGLSSPSLVPAGSETSPPAPWESWA